MDNREADIYPLLIVVEMGMNGTTTFISFLALTTVCLLIVDFFYLLLLHAPLHCVILHAGCIFISCLCNLILCWISVLCC